MGLLKCRTTGGLVAGIVVLLGLATGANAYTNLIVIDTTVSQLLDVGPDTQITVRDADSTTGFVDASGGSIAADSRLNLATGGPGGVRVENTGTFTSLGELAAQTGDLLNSGTLNLNGGETNGSAVINDSIINVDGDVELAALHTNRDGSQVNFLSTAHAFVGRSSGNPGGIFDILAGATAQNSGYMTSQNGGALRIKGADGSTPSGSFTNNAGATWELISVGPFAGSISVQSDDVVNNGTILNTSGRFQIDPNFRDPPTGPQVRGTGDYIQNAGVAIIDGYLEQDEIRIMGGTMGGNGRVNATSGSVVVGPNGWVSPGLSPGTLTVESDLNLDGKLEVEFIRNATGFSPNGDDLLIVDGELNFDPNTSELRVMFDFIPTAGQTFTFITAGSIVGTPSEIFVTGPFAGEEEEEEEFLEEASFSASSASAGPISTETNGGYQFTFSIVNNANGTQSLGVIVVPEPASLGLIGLGALALVRRRRVG